MTTYTIRCPACGWFTQHKRRLKRNPEEDETGSYYTCIRCRRTRRISPEELEELLYEASRRVLKEAM